MVFQCRLQKLENLQWHPSVGQFQLSFSSGIPLWGCFNTLRPRQNDRRLADENIVDIFKYISLDENFCISIKISSKYVP